jgi:hypothetical protein
LKYTKAQIKNAMYLLLDETLPKMRCEKVEREGNWDCHRCDDCMFEQYIKRAKAGEQPRKITGK